MLKKSLFHDALQQLDFKLEIDLFASRVNAQLIKYVSFRPVPNAIVVYAIMTN